MKNKKVCLGVIVIAIIAFLLSYIISYANTGETINVNLTKLDTKGIGYAIGNPTTLESGLMQKNSGYIDKVIKPYDKLATVEKAKQIEIAKYDAEWKLKYIEGEE